MKYEALFRKHLEFTKIQGVEGKAHCPFHSHDETPSFSANLENGMWQCFGCGASGNYRQFLEKIESKVPGENDESEISVREIDNLHENLLNNTFVLEYAKQKRLWSEDVIKRYKLGWNGYRVSIPIEDEEGSYVNVRLYDMLHKFEPSEKVKSWKTGLGKVRLFPIHTVSSDVIYLFEGEPDTILALSFGLPAITLTTGAAAATKQVQLFAKYFNKKVIYVVYDTDEAGLMASSKVCDMLSKIAHVYNVILPEKDFTEYIQKNNYESFLKIANSTDKYELHEQTVVDTSKIYDISLNDASKPFYYNKLVKFKAIVSGKDLVPYLIPKSVLIECPCEFTFCKGCGIAVHNGKAIYDIPKLSPMTLEILGNSTRAMNAALKETLLIPKRCTFFNISPKDTQNIEELRLIPELLYTDTTKAEEYVIRQAYYCGSGIRTNTTYEFIGTTIPHPKSQHVTHFLNESESVSDIISNFELDDDKLELLKLFSVNSSELDSKINTILDDLTFNVTKIYQRKDLIMAVLLSYFSPIGFKFLNAPVKKGWIEALIIGDTRCGKTETVEKMINHFKLGELATGENVSFAGLIGGIQQIANRFMISWGKIPLNDRRLLVIDEASSMDLETIEKLSGIRSSGIAEITKIQAEKTFARTRLIWMSNPRSTRPINFYDLGILTVKELIGKPEDIARFDFALILAAEEVDKGIINKLVHQSVPHTYTSQAFNTLLMWAWSRNQSQIIFEEGVEKLILSKAIEFSNEYASDLPLIDSADFRMKLARMSISIATLLFSTNEDYSMIVVKPEHVEYVCKFIKEIYDKPACAYKIYAERRFKENNVRDSKDIVEKLSAYSKDFIECLVDTQYVRLSDIEDFGGVDHSEAKNVISFLIKQRAIKRKHSYYIKTPAFIELLKKMLIDPSIKFAETTVPKNEEI